MKQSVLAGLSILALAACTAQPLSQAGAGAQPALPTSYAGGSPINTTSAFDGTYTFVATQNINKQNELEMAGGNAPITCQYYNNMPPVTIHNGLARFQLPNYTFQGYVTPQGYLKMDSGYGQVIDGQINNQGIFNARGSGACDYNATWRRSI